MTKGKSMKHKQHPEIIDEWPYPLPDYNINHYIILNRGT